MMLHTDAFNKNNKYKMQKADYIRNTRGQYVSEDILACFYDNICYTPFIHVEDDFDVHSERHGSIKSKRYFECQSNFGVFVRPERLEVGDYPVLDEFADEEDEF